LSKKKTFISNISRGKIIKQDDLIAALRAGKLRGAALDVATPEPLPSDSELWDVPNLILTPHISGLSKAYTDRSFQILSANLTKIEKGDKLFNVVDRKKGY
jgi:phosphoglycerate dehydrogenase-like enzyme